MSTSAGKTAVVLLAAGSSSRLGSPKQLLLYKGSTLLDRAIDTAKAFSAAVVLVTGANAGLLEPMANRETLVEVYNDGWEEGMASSIRKGLEAVMENFPETAAVLFMVCDQPMLTAAHVNNLQQAMTASGKLVAASAYAGTLGIPALFDRQLFPELLTLTGETGAKKLILQHRENTVAVDFPGGKWDVDTAEDYAALTV